MPARRKPAVEDNPQYALNDELLQEEREKILAKDPDSYVGASYARAIKELKAISTPIPFPGAIKVKYLGPKMIELIKKKLARGFAPSPIQSSGSSESLESLDFYDNDLLRGAAFRLNRQTPPEPASNLVAAKRRPAQAKPKSRSMQKGKQRAPSVDLYSDEEEQNDSTPICTKWKPAAGSNAHAVLVALYTACTPASQRTWLPPSIVMQHAVPWCPQAGAHTIAMTNMFQISIDSLVVRRYLERDRMDGFISITYAGFQVAERCAVECGLEKLTVTQSNLHLPRFPDCPVSQPAHPAPTTTQHPPLAQTHAVPSRSYNAERVAQEPAAGSRERIQVKAVAKKFATGAFASVYQEKAPTVALPAASTSVFAFAYLDEADKRVTQQISAARKPHSVSFELMYKVEFRSKQARHPLAVIVEDKQPFNRQPADLEGPTEIGWIPQSKATDSCPGLGAAASQPEASKKAKRPKADVDLMAGAKRPTAASKDMFKLPTAARMPKMQRVALHGTQTRPHGIVARNQVLAAASQPRAAVNHPQCPPPKLTASSSSGRADPSDVSSASPVHGQKPVVPTASATVNHRLVSVTTETEAPARCLPTAQPMPDVAFKRLVIPPGTFSTHVYIDHRERVISQALVASLSRQGISCEVAALTLGDYLWTARRRVPTGDGYDTIVLAICERKRRDDFINCIKSDTYIEQKRRIMQSGVRKKFYIVEDHQVQQVESSETFVKAVDTSMAQTLTVDDFNLNIASNQEETVQILTNISIAVRAENESRPLSCIPDAHVKPGQISRLQQVIEQSHPDSPHYVSMNAFLRLCGKTRTMTSTWAKMVRSVKGWSDEATQDYLEQFSTPAEAFAAIEAREQQQNEIVCSLQSMQGRVTKKMLEAQQPELYFKQRLESSKPRQVSIPASARMWQLYTQQTYADEQYINFD